VLEVAKFFKMNIVDKVSFMRKIVIDGSNTSGFQRTALIGTGGCIEENNVNLSSICLEEDSCKIIKQENSNGINKKIYDLSRLGIPLIELATEPDIKTPDQAKEVAEFIGMVLRSTGKVKRGLGTIRQDVNVSIKNGVRVEIKGAQQLDMIPTLIINEILRQDNLNNIYSELRKRHIVISKSNMITDLLKNTTSKILRKSLDNNGIIIGIKITNIKGFFKLNIQPDKRFGTEIAGRVKPLGVKGLFHSDELPNYGVTQKEVDLIKKELECLEDDGFIIIADEKDKAISAINEVKQFLTDLKLAKEVRQALPDGTTKFLRPMPGSARMYPETDVPSFEINSELLDSLPKIVLLTQKYKELESKYNISLSQGKEFLKEGFDLEKLSLLYSNLSPKFIVEFLINYPKDIKKRYGVECDVKKYYKEILQKINDDIISKDAGFEVLLLMSQDLSVDYEQFKAISEDKIEKIIKSVIDKNKDAPFNALMGLSMKELKGKTDGKVVNKILNKLIK